MRKAAFTRTNHPRALTEKERSFTRWQMPTHPRNFLIHVPSKP
jgi:hypothetical protein